MNDEVSERWRRYGYPRYAHDATHPARLRTIAHWLGVQAPPTRTARVLELGCAAGDNLLPMAARLPHARFVGIDLNAKAIALGQSMAADQGLDNIELSVCDLRDFAHDDGPFDYIIAHGLYSWIPDDARDAMMALVARHLSPEGIAHISYNTLPGWRVWGVFREMLLERFGHLDDPVTQAEYSLDYMNWLLESQPGGDAWWASLVRSEHFRLNLGQVINVAHDQLSPVNDPVWTREFVAHAEQHDLVWMGLADLDDNFLARRPEATSQLVDGVVDRVERATMMDGVVGRTFSHAVLCHRGRLPHLPTQPLAGAYWWAVLERPDELHLDDDEPVSFSSAENTASIEVQSPLFKHALDLLASTQPFTLPQLGAALRGRLGFARVSDADLSDIERALFEWARMGLVRGDVEDPAPVLQPSNRPIVDPCVRYAAANQHPVIGRRHNMVQVDEIDRLLLPLLDGEHDLYDVARVLEERLGKGPLGGVRQDAELPPPGPERMAVAASLLRARCRDWTRTWLFSAP